MRRMFSSKWPKNPNFFSQTTHNMKTTIIINSEVVGNDAKHMTSLEIAEVTGKQHNHVMRDIRNMESAWEKHLISGESWAEIKQP